MARATRRLLAVLAVVANADCFSLRAPTRHATRCGKPCMAAKKRTKQVTRREALSGGGFDSDAAYKDIANAGLREPLLFGGIALTAAFGLSRRGQLVETLTALDAAQPHKTTGIRVPAAQVAAAKAKFKVELTVSWPAASPAEYAWLKDAATGEVSIYSQ